MKCPGRRPSPSSRCRPTSGRTRGRQGGFTHLGRLRRSNGIWLPQVVQNDGSVGVAIPSGGTISMTKSGDIVQWHVKFDGPCARCGEVQRAGVAAHWDNRGRKLYCLGCATELGLRAAPSRGGPASQPVDIGTPRSLGPTRVRTTCRASRGRRTRAMGQPCRRLGASVHGRAAVDPGLGHWCRGRRGARRDARGCAGPVGAECAARTADTCQAGVFVVDAKAPA